jgi:hypothetical protein
MATLPVHSMVSVHDVINNVANELDCDTLTDLTNSILQYVYIDTSAARHLDDLCVEYSTNLRNLDDSVDLEHNMIILDKLILCALQAPSNTLAVFDAVVSANAVMSQVFLTDYSHGNPDPQHLCAVILSCCILKTALLLNTPPTAAF